MKFERMGWIIAATLAGAMFGMGFQGSSEKSATVDIERVFNESSYAKKQTEGLRNMGQARLSVMEFVRTYRTLKPEDAVKFRDLSVKENRTPTETADLERIKTQAQTDEQKYRQLSTKPNPTQAEVDQISEFNKRKDATAELLAQWNEDFTGEIQAKQDALRTETLQRVKEAVAAVAKQQGYSIVFAQTVAPYSANDLTEAALKSMNDKK